MLLENIINIVHIIVYMKCLQCVSFNYYNKEK